MHDFEQQRLSSAQVLLLWQTRTPEPRNLRTSEPVNQNPSTRAPVNPRTCLVTGASSGIGEAFAEVFAAEGYNLVLTARREDRLEAVAARLRQAHGVEVQVIPADLSLPEAPARLCAEIAARGLTIDALVNNAGYGVPGPYTRTTWEQHAAFLNVLLVSVAELTRPSQTKLPQPFCRRARSSR